MYEALSQIEDGPQITLIANEASAGYMAVGTTLFAHLGAERPSIPIVNVIGGPGLTHALPGIALASLSSLPMVILTTGPKSSPDAAHAFQLHDVSNSSILGGGAGWATSATKAPVLIPSSVDAIPDCITHAACLAFTYPRGPVAVEVPSDYLTSWSQTPPHAAPSPLLHSALEEFYSVSGPTAGLLPESVRSITVMHCQDSARVAVKVDGEDVIVETGGSPLCVGMGIAMAVTSAPAPILVTAVTTDADLLSHGSELITAVSLATGLVVAVLDPVLNLQSFADGVGCHYVANPAQAGSRARDSSRPVLTPMLSSAKSPQKVRRSPQSISRLVFPQPYTDLFSVQVMARPSSSSSLHSPQSLPGFECVVESGGYGQAAAFIGDGASRTTPDSGRGMALVVADLAAAPMLPTYLSGVGEAYMDDVPLVLLMVVPDEGSDAGLGLGPLVSIHVESARALTASASRVPPHSPNLVLPSLCKAAQAAALASKPVLLTVPASSVVLSSIGATAPAAGQEWELSDSGLASLMGHESAVYARRSTLPSSEYTRLATRVEATLDAHGPGSVLLYLGRGASGVSAETLVGLASSMGAVVASTFSGKGVYPESCGAGYVWPGFGAQTPESLAPFYAGVKLVFVVGARGSEMALAHYRTTALADSEYTLYHIDRDPSVLGGSALGGIPVLADASEFVTSLFSALRTVAHVDDPEFARATQALYARVDQARADVTNTVRSDGGPGQVFASIQAVIPNAVITTDSGNGTVYALEAVSGRYLAPVDYSSMGYAVPAAVGASLASGDNGPGVAVVGDGAVLMTGLDAIASARAHNTGLLVVVLRDGELGMMSGIQRAVGREPFCTILPTYDVCSLLGSIPGVQLAPRVEVDGLQSVLRGWNPASDVLVVEVMVSYTRPSLFTSGVMMSREVPRSLPTMGVTGGPSQRVGLVEGKSEGAVDPFWVLSNAVRLSGAVVGVEDVTRSIRMTYQEVYDRVCAGVAGLAEEVQRGDRIAIMCRNSSAVYEAHYVAAGLRAVLLNVNVGLTSAEIEYIFDDAEPVVVIADSEFEPVLAKAGVLSRVSRVLWVDDGASARSAHQGWERLLGGGGGDGVAVERAYNARDGFQMYYTSGTTGHPKGVVLSGGVVMAHMLGAVAEFGIRGTDVWGHIAPMFHLVDAFGIYALTLLGGQHVVWRSFDPRAALEGMAEKGVSITNLASTMVVMMVGVGREETPLDFSRLRMLSCGGSPVPDAVVAGVSTVFGPQVEFFVSYGMTECCGKISMSLLSRSVTELEDAATGASFVQTSGRPFALMEVRVVNQDTHSAGTWVEVPADGESVGEIQVRGPTVFSGYWKGAGSGSEFTQDGRWFRTGDLGVRLAHGYLRVVDRAKNMILVGGENVYSAEVESVIYSAGVAKMAVVVGVEDDMLGEVVKGVVVLDDGVDVSHAESVLRSVCAERLARFKNPMFWDFVDELPMTGSGKVKKFELLGPRPSAVATPPPTFQIVWEEVGAVEGGGGGGGGKRVSVVDVGVLGDGHGGGGVGEGERVVARMWEVMEEVMEAGREAEVLVVVTREAFCVGGVGGEGGWAQGVWGMMRSYAAEKQGLGLPVVLVDAEVGADAVEIADAAVGVMSGGGGCLVHELSVRQGAWWRAHLVEQAWRSAAGPGVSGKEVIVTGGLGGLGLVFLEQLCGLGVSTLVLFARQARRKWSAKRKRAVAQLEQTYPSVSVEVEVVADMGDEARVAARVGAHPNAKWIFHLAGVLDDGFAEDVDEARFRSVVEGKVRGAWALHAGAAAGGLALDGFVLFSSIYSVLGFPQLTHYAGANAALNGLAAARVAAGMPALAVGWGVFGGAGMAAELGDGFARFWTSLGFSFLDVNVVGRGAQAGASQGWLGLWAVESGDEWKDSVSSSLLLPTYHVRSVEESEGGDDDGGAEWDTWMERVAGVVAQVSGRSLGGAGTVDVDAPFAMLGIDSLGTTGLRAGLEKAFGVGLSGMAVIRHGTVRGMAAHVKELCGASSSQASSSSSQVVAQAAAQASSSQASSSSSQVVAKAVVQTVAHGREGVDPRAVVGDDVVLGEGVTIGPFSIVTGGAVIGRGTQIASHVVIEGAVVFGENNEVGPFSHFAGDGIVIGSGNSFSGHNMVGHGPEDYVHRGPAMGGIEVGDDNVFREYVNIHRPEGVPPKYEGVTRVGSHCYVMNYAHIAHDMVMEDHVTVTCSVQFGGYCRVMHHANVGIGSSVHQFTTIGPHAFISLGSAVARDVPPFTIFTTRSSSPAGSAHSINFIGLSRSGVALDDIQTLESWYSTADKQDRNVIQAMMLGREAVDPLLVKDDGDEDHWFAKEIRAFLQHRVLMRRIRPIAPVDW